MKLIETGFSGLFLIKPDVFTDSRGYFFESFNIESFKKLGINFIPVQDNESKSSKGVIRGLHYQLKPFDQAKLIRVVDGKIWDVALDLRRSSPSYGKWYGTLLDSVEKNQLLIPKGFAHGFSVLSDEAVILYKVDSLYNRQAERGIALDDPALAIDWNLGNMDPVVSLKDTAHPSFEKAEKNF